MWNDIILECAVFAIINYDKAVSSILDWRRGADYFRIVFSTINSSPCGIFSLLSVCTKNCPIFVN